MRSNKGNELQAARLVPAPERALEGWAVAAIRHDGRSEAVTEAGVALTAHPWNAGGEYKKAKVCRTVKTAY